MKRLLILIMILLSLMAGAALGEAEPSLTLMVYVCGSNLETEAGAASADLAEMMAHYPDDGSLRVIVMPSGSLMWQNEISAEETAIYELTSAGLTKLCTLPLQSMGEPDALTALLEYGYTHAPASRYALIMWDHGAGPNIGLCFDELFQTGDSMDGLTLDELSTALQNSPAATNKLDWIGFDACLMASLETACAVAPYADYMIASQETEPSSGWDYAFVSHAANDPSGASTGPKVIDGYFDSLSDSLAPLTLSCISLSDMPAISETLNQLFSNLHLSLDANSYSTFADCRIQTKSPGYSTGYEYDLVDLVDLLQLYEDAGLADCSTLLDQLDHAIVESRSNRPFINGLSMYFPHYGAQDHVSFPSFEEYAAFIADMSAIRLGKPLTDWSETHRPKAEQSNSVTRVTMELSPSQAAMLDSATLFIIKQMAGNDHQLVYRTNDVALTADNILTATYEEQALFIVDAQGEVVSTALPYLLQDDAVVLDGMLSRNIDSLTEEEEWLVPVRCLFRQDEQGRYQLSEIQESTADPARQGKASLRLEDYDTLSIYQGSVMPVYAADGKPLPPAQWNKGDMTYGWFFDLADYPDWTIAFRSQQDDRSRYALLQMTDMQNHVICSDLLPIPNPNLVDFPCEEQTLIDNEVCSIRFMGALEIKGIEPALRLVFECENRDPQKIHVAVDMLQFDDVVLSDYSVASASLEPGESKAFEIEVSRESLEALGVQTAEMLLMELSISHDYINTFLEACVSCALDADLSSIAPEPVQRNVLDTVTVDGLVCSLYDLAFAEDGYLEGKMSIHNASDTAIALDATAFYLNNLPHSGYLTDAFHNAKLTSGAICHTGFRINMRDYPSSHSRPENACFLLESLGMTQLKTLNVTLYNANTRQYARVPFTLAQPLALPINEEFSRVNGWPVIYKKIGVTIRLADFTWTAQFQYRYVNLLVDNATAADIHIRIPEFDDASPAFLVNGHSPSYVYSSLAPANAITMQSLWYTAGEEFDTMERIDMQLLITDSHSRNDPIHVSIDAPAEAHADGGYFILDASEMQVTVAVPE